MKLDLEMFLEIAEHYENCYFRFYENADIRVDEDLFVTEINELIKELLVRIYECSENYAETRLWRLGEGCVVEKKQKNESYDLETKRLGLLFI